jgi:radical SAM protein with 4Fe4S-binding SPASM domain
MVHWARRRYFTPQPDRDCPDAGIFFEIRKTGLSRGHYVLRCGVQISQDLIRQSGGLLRLRCLPARGATHALAEAVFDIGPSLERLLDDLFLEFDLPGRLSVKVQGHVSSGLGRIHLRQAVLHAVPVGSKVDYTRIWDAVEKLPANWIRGVMIGTNGGCNASCPSCPTNKLIREHLPAGVMSMEMFKRIIDGLAHPSIRLVKNKIGLGLFGEPLMDPLIVERAKYVRQRLPNVKLLLNTNAGPFNERRHRELIDLVSRFSVHVEALSEEKYAELMAPLRAPIVFPKIERLIELAPNRVNIAVPLSRGNIDEFPALRKYWLGKGAREVAAIAFSNRTTDSLDYSARSLAPVAASCSERVGADLVIDWDGKILPCCQDFLKREPLGDLGKQSLSEALQDRRRHDFVDLLRHSHWSASKSCRDCKIDTAQQTKRALEVGGQGDAAFL